MSSIDVTDSPRSPRHATPFPMFDRQLSTVAVTRMTRLIGAGWAAIVLVTMLVAPLWAVDKSWNTGDGSWYTASNWTPHGVPGVNDVIRIGNLPGVQNSTVSLTAPGAGYDLLEISGGMTLDLNGGELVSFDDAYITGANSRLIVRPALGPNVHDFQGVLHVGAGAHFEMRDDAPVRIFDDSESSGVISGRGNVLIASPIPFRNNGMINPGANGGVVLTQGSGSLFPIDLDGPASTGQLLLNTPFSVLEVIASSLSDSFSGTVNMGSGSLLNMNLTDGWTADASSTFNIASAIVGAAAQIDGGHFTFGGHLNIGGTEGHLRILSDATLTPTADVFIGADDVLEFDGTTILDGGTYQFASGLGVVRFDGPTTVHNGTFQMNGNTHLHGRVEFNGATVWNGNLTVNGFGRQNGNATVSGPTVISGAVFDLNGNNTTWQVNNSLVVNVDRVGSNVDNNFNGTMNITGGVLGRVTINLTNPNDPWVLYGEMNLAGSGALPVTRVAGNRMAVFGDLNVTSGIAQITADVSILDQATVDIAANSTLRMRGHTTVGAATIFNGAGTLQNGLGGSLLLDTGVSLANVGLTNNGVLRIGEIGAGVASVDRFLSSATAAWSMDVGGYVAGIEHDLLQVTGGSAMLDGLLAVTLIDPSGGAGATFLPSIGDEFTILRARGGVEGAFLNDPVSQVGGLTYDWSVIYNPNTVVLRLDAIVPEPSTLALCIVAVLGMSLGRNRLASREVQPNSV